MFYKLLFLIFPFIIIWPEKSLANNYLFFMCLIIPFIAVKIDNLPFKVFLFYVWAHVIVAFVLSVLGGLEYADYIFPVLRCVGVAGVAYYCISTSNIDFTNIICISAVLHSVITISFICGISIFYHPYIKLTDLTVVGYLVNSNYAGPYLAICCPLFFRLKRIQLKIKIKKLKMYWRFSIPMSVFVILPIVAIFILNSVTGVLTLLVGLAVMIDKRLIIAAVAIGALYIFFFDNASFFNHSRFTGRWLPHLKTQLSGHWINILLGYGAHAQAENRGYVHNGFLTCFMKFGAIGLSIAAWYLVKMYRKVRNDRVFRGCFGAIITAIIGIHVFHIPTLTILILVVFAMFEYKKPSQEVVIC